MNPLLLAELIRVLGTVGLPLIMKLKDDIDRGRTATTVTTQDLEELRRMSQLTAAAIFQAAGVTPPV